MKFINDLLKEFSLFPEAPNKDGELDFSVDGDEGNINSVPMGDESDDEFGDFESDDESGDFGSEDGRDLDDLDSELGSSEESPCKCDGDDIEGGEFDLSDFDSDSDLGDDSDFDFDELGDTPLGDEDDSEDDEFSLNLFNKPEVEDEEEFKFI